MSHKKWAVGAVAQQSPDAHFGRGRVDPLLNLRSRVLTWFYLQRTVRDHRHACISKMQEQSRVRTLEKSFATKSSDARVVHAEMLKFTTFAIKSFHKNTTFGEISSR